MLGINFGGNETTAEGWFGKGKASAIVSVVVLMVMILSITIVPLVLFLGNRDSTPSGLPGSSSGTQVQTDTVQIPSDGQRIRIVNVDFPPELKITWEKLLKRNIGLSPVGTLKNISDKTVAFNEITFVLDGEKIGSWEPPFLDPSPTSRTMDRGLKPGQEAKVKQEMFGWSEASKALEARMVNFRIIGGSTTAPTATSTPTKPTIATLTYKKNPVTPGEVITSLIGFMNDGKLSEAAKLYAPGLITETELKRFASEILKGRRIVSVVVLSERINGDVAIVEGVQRFNDGDEEKFDTSLKKIDGKWKLSP